MITSKQVVQIFIEQGWNEGDLSAYDRYVDENYTDNDPAAPGIEGGREVQRALIEHYRAAFSRFRVIIDELVAEDDRVVMIYTARGVHTGEFMGHPPTQRSFEVTGMSRYVIRDGRIVTARSNWDTLGLLKQLGLMP